MISDHLYTKSLTPLGYLDYDLVIDGRVVDATSMTRRVQSWQRTVNIREATVKTTLELTDGVGLDILAFTPYGKEEVFFHFTFRGLDGISHRVQFRPRLKLALRPRSGGKPIPDSIPLREAGTATARIVAEATPDGAFSPHEHYLLDYRVTGSPGGVPFADESGLGVTFDSDVSEDSVQMVCRFRLANSEEAKAVSPPEGLGTESITLGDLEEALASHLEDYANYYDSGARIDVGDAKRELLFNNSLYLLRIGGTYDAGFPLQFLLFHAESWFGSTFWDLNFIADGLIRTNHLEPVRNVIRWLNRAKNPEGRPFAWITRYDGSSAMPPEWSDTGFMVNAAFAMVAIRYYEATRDREFLASDCYPLIRTIAEYAVSERVRREGDYFIGGPAGFDVNAPQEINETFSTAWFVVVLRKAAEYAEILDADPALRKDWREVTENIRFEQGPDGYHQSRNHPKPGNWVSMLLYPTEAAPLLNLEVFAENRKTQCFLDDYPVHQPWCFFWQALSDMRLDPARADEADRNIDEGLRFVYGPGYFSEIAPEGKGGLVGLPPYATAHGTYLTAITEQLVSGSIWDNTLNVFAHLPNSLSDREIEFERILSSRGILVSGRRTRDSVKISLNGDGPVALRVEIPKGRGSETPLRISVGGKTIKEPDIRNSIFRTHVSLAPDTPIRVSVEREQ